MKPIQVGTESSTAAAVMVLHQYQRLLSRTKWDGAYLETGGAAQNMSVADMVLDAYYCVVVYPSIHPRRGYDEEEDRKRLPA